MKYIGLTLSALLISIQLTAQSEMQTKSISVFKNGKSFVIKEGSVKTADNIYTLYKMPDALFGTLWFSGSKSKVTQVVSKMESVNEPIERKAIGFRDLLYANKGKQLSIATSDNKIYAGTVDDFELSEEVNSQMLLRQAELNETYGTSIDYRLFPGDPQVLLIKIDNKWISLNPGDIKTIEFSEKPENTIKTNVKVKKPLVKVTFEKGGDQELRMMYLQNGISWTPTYMLEINSDNNATLKLQAEVSNSIEDIAGTDMNFVVGVPNFKFAENPSILTSIIGKITQNYSSNSRSNYHLSNAIISTQMAGGYGRSRDYDEGDIPEGIEGEASEDYYFYNVKNVKLEKGGRAIYPLYSKLLKIKHLYECNLSKADGKSSRDYSDYSFDTKKCDVFHSIEIKNSTSDPLTTGPVMIVDKSNKPLAQDLIKYTGAGQSSFIQLTQSPDIWVEETETIIDTKEEVKKVSGYDYDLVTIRNEIVIVNSKKQSIDMAIRKTFGGTIKDVSIKYNNKQKVDKNSLNPTNNIELRPVLKAGETLKISYTYETYIRN